MRLANARAYNFHTTAEDPQKLLSAESGKEKTFWKVHIENEFKKLKSSEQVKLLRSLL